jgi:octaprenyl-diphosphate synthase
MQEGSREEADLIRKSLQSGGLESLDRIIDVVRAAGGLDYTRKLAEEQAQKAINCLEALPPSPYKSALDAMAQFSIARYS